MEPQVHGVFRNRHIKLIDELNVLEGTEVIVNPLVPESNPAEGQMLRRGTYRGDTHITLDKFKGMRRGKGNSTSSLAVVDAHA